MHHIPLPAVYSESLPLTFFGLIVTCAVIASSAVVAWNARRHGEDPVVVFDLLGWMLVLSVVFARFFYVVNPPPSVAGLYSREWYLTHPLDLQIGPMAIWSGGLSMAGILVGAVLGALVVIRRHRLNGWLWADIALPGLLLLLIIGPWGNLLMGQMIGQPTTLPWGIGLDYPPPPYDNVRTYGSGGILFHPSPAYVSLWALVMAAGLWGLNRRYARYLHNGDIFLAAALLYGTGLFLLNFLQIDVNPLLLGLSETQIVALIIVVWSTGMMVQRRILHHNDVERV